MHLQNIGMLKKTFGVPVGFSDHSLGTSVSLAAIALGACIIERHFTLNKNMPGWDHSISSDPPEMKYLVEEGKKIFHALGETKRIVGEAELNKRKEFRRSIIAARNLKKGEEIKIDDLNFKRPEEGGISPAKFRDLIGRTLKRDVDFDHQIKPSDLI